MPCPENMICIRQQSIGFHRMINFSQEYKSGVGHAQCKRTKTIVLWNDSDQKKLKKKTFTQCIMKTIAFSYVHTTKLNGKSVMKTNSSQKTAKKNKICFPKVIGEAIYKTRIRK